MPDSRYRVSVQVQSQYLPEQSVPGDRMFAFAYTVTIRNDGSVPAQLVSRHWHIEDETGKVVEVDGLGVVGQQPLLAPGQSFEYTSGSQIGTPKGSMQGSYFFVAEDGHRFDVPIPLFVLAMPRTLH